jgi:hypothetical protein
MGSHVRVNAQLIDGATDAHLWAQRFDGDAADLFALGNEITSRIAVALKLELLAAEGARPTEHPDALDFILQGRAIYLKGLRRDNYGETISLSSVHWRSRCHRVLGGNVDARHHCYLCLLVSSIDHFGASRPFASKQSRSNRTHCLPYRASGKRMRVRISAHPLAGSLGPLALGPLHFEDAQESISRKHGELGGPN